MLAEFFQAVSKAALESARPLISQPEGLPSDRLWVFNPDGTRDEVILPEKPMRATASDLRTLVAVARQAAAATEIWYSEAMVCGFPDRLILPDVITMPLTRTPRWRLLSTLGGEILDQKGFLKTLRLRLGDAVESSLVLCLRKLLFRAQSKAEGDLQRQKASIGKSLEVQLEGESPLPETTCLHVPVWEELDYRAMVEAAIEIDLEAQRFQLIPLPGEVERGLKSALRYLAEEIATEVGEQALPIYAGVAK